MASRSARRSRLAWDERAPVCGHSADLERRLSGTLDGRLAFQGPGTLLAGGVLFCLLRPHRAPLLSSGEARIRCRCGGLAGASALPRYPQSHGLPDLSAGAHSPLLVGIVSITAASTLQVGLKCGLSELRARACRGMIHDRATTFAGGGLLPAGGHHL